MADLYGTTSSPAPECEEISSFLHQLLHNSSSSSSLTSPLPPNPPPPPAAAVAELSFGGRERSYSDQIYYLAKGNAREGFSELGDLNGDSEKVAEVSVRPRSLSKRSRAPEVHNLSEKRRRSRINEKMKALQNLIPNSNKTDKASMLDEAIEYLKQLQLQVQMLTMRNGLSLHPMCLPGVFQPMQLPLKGMNFDEGSGLLNTDAAIGAFSENDENLARTSLSFPNRCTVSNQSIVLPSVTNITSSETRFGSSD